MFLNSLLALLLFIAGALGQGTVIDTPQPGTRLSSGQTFTLQVLRPFTRGGSLEIGYGVGLWPCGSSPCPAPGVPAGNILYNGPYNPAFEELPGIPYQNFSLTIPPTG
ncbi:hypothetical protein BKA70DRAFT_1422537 [Coprinopsis sp. MPI-PUGE-AT-0042]|nr:hypothetical protein BKA70DRAFT_1422537 [Coprinopsis sp. MPI-PUGE-AT-0042]